MTQVEQPTTVAARTRVLIVDDHPMTRAGLVHVIDHQPDLIVCGEAESAAQALDILDSSRPDLLLIDITLPGKSGLELIKDVKAMQPELLESLYVERALRAGARGYIMKHEATNIMMSAIRRVLRGEIYVSDKMMTKLLGRLIPGDSPDTNTSILERLSNRELEVFRAIGEGHSTRHIAAVLHVSIKTVESHRAHIKEKLQLNDTTELVRYAMQWVENGKIGSV